MFGRDMRNHTVNNGIKFTKGSVDWAGGMCTNLMKEDSNPFLDGPDYIISMRKAVKKTKTNFGKSLAKGKGVDWVLTDYQFKR